MPLRHADHDADKLNVHQVVSALFTYRINANGGRLTAASTFQVWQ
jgi:hypothetical protein